MHTRLLRQRGFSLIELMVTTVLGLLIVAAIMGVLLTSNRNYNQDERFSRLQENGRFAVHFLAQDISMAAFWGNLVNPSSVNTINADCGVTLNSGASITMLDNATDPNATFDCIANLEFEAATDVIFINRVQGVSRTEGELTADDNNRVFLVTNGNSGQLKQYDGSNGPAAGESAWRYVPRIYYIKKQNNAGEDIPTLYRKTLNTAIPPTFIDEELVEGIENIQIQFGIDSNADTVPDAYVTAPTAAQLAQAVTARIHVLARGLTADNIHVDTKVYNLGEGDYKPYAPTGADNPGTQKPTDVYRRVYSSTVVLRNVINLAALER